MENKDTPDAVDMAAIRRDVRAAVAGDATLCILEGFLLHDDELMAAADGVLFLRASLDACLGRRLARSERSAHEAEGCRQNTTAPWPEQLHAPALERLLAADDAKVRVPTRSWRRRSSSTRRSPRWTRCRCHCQHTPARTRRPSRSACARNRAARRRPISPPRSRVAASARRQRRRSWRWAPAARARQRRGRRDRAAARRGGRGDDGAPPAAAQRLRPR